MRAASSRPVSSTTNGRPSVWRDASSALAQEHLGEVEGLDLRELDVDRLDLAAEDAAGLGDLAGVAGDEHEGRQMTRWLGAHPGVSMPRSSSLAARRARKDSSRAATELLEVGESAVIVEQQVGSRPPLFAVALRHQPRPGLLFGEAALDGATQPTFFVRLDGDDDVEIGAVARLDQQRRFQDDDRRFACLARVREIVVAPTDARRPRCRRAGCRPRRAGRPAAADRRRRPRRAPPHRRSRRPPARPPRRPRRARRPADRRRRPGSPLPRASWATVDLPLAIPPVRPTRRRVNQAPRGACRPRACSPRASSPSAGRPRPARG